MPSLISTLPTLAILAAMLTSPGPLATLFNSEKFKCEEIYVKISQIRRTSLPRTRYYTYNCIEYIQIYIQISKETTPTKDEKEKSN